MKLKITKQTLIDSLFYIPYVMTLLAFLFRATFFSSLIEGIPFKFVVISSIVLLLIRESVKGLSYSYKTLLIAILSLIFFVLSIRSSIFSYDFSTPLMFLFLFVGRDINFKNIARLTIFLSAIFLLFMLLANDSGQVLKIVGSTGRGYREYLGFRYPLFPSVLLSNITFLYLYLRYERIRFWEFLILFALNYYIYHRTLSRLVFITSIFAILVIALFRIFPSLQKCRVWILTSLVFPLSMWASYYFATHFDFLNGVYFRINQILGGRLALAKSSLVEHGVRFFSRQIKWVGNGLDSNGLVDRSATYNYVDNFFIQNLQQMGLIFMVLFLIVMVIFMYKAYRNKDIILLLIFVFIALHCMIDDLKLYMHYNTFWFAIIPTFLASVPLNQEDSEGKANPIKIRR